MRSPLRTHSHSSAHAGGFAGGASTTISSSDSWSCDRYACWMHAAMAVAPTAAMTIWRGLMLRRSSSSESEATRPCRAVFADPPAILERARRGHELRLQRREPEAELVGDAHR